MEPKPESDEQHSASMNKLFNEKQLLQVSQSIRSLNEKSEYSDFDNHGTFPIPSIQPNDLKLKIQESLHSQGSNLQFNPKRVSPIQIQPNLIKKVKKDIPSPQFFDSIIEEELGNRKITEYFGQRTQERDKKKDLTFKEDNQKNPIIKSLKEKISKKNHAIEDTKMTIEKVKQKTLALESQFEELKKNRIIKVIEVLKETYEQKIFVTGFMESMNRQQAQVLEERQREIEQKCKVLKDLKERKKKSRRDHLSDEESNILIEAYDRDRTNYLAAWINKLEKEREKVLGEVSRCYKHSTAKVFYSLPDSVKSQLKGDLLLSIYAPLAALSKLEEKQQILCLNLRNLQNQSLVLIRYPSFLNSERKMEFETAMKQFHRKSQMLKNSAAVLISTLFEQFTFQSLMYGRDHWENSSKLSQIIDKYEGLPQPIAKFVIKSCLQVLSDLKTKTNWEMVLTSEQVLLNDKFDVRVDCSCGWILPLYKEFRQIYSSKLFDITSYPPEMIQSSAQECKNVSTWSVGVLFYEILYGRKPFGIGQYENTEDFFIKNELNDLNFPSKPTVSGQCRQFIKACLQNQQDRLSLNAALKHPYYSHK